MASGEEKINSTEKTLKKHKTVWQLEKIGTREIYTYSYRNKSSDSREIIKRLKCTRPEARSNCCSQKVLDQNQRSKERKHASEPKVK